MTEILVNISVHSVRDDEVTWVRTIEGDFVTTLSLTPRKFKLRFCLKNKRILDCEGVARDLAHKIALESLNQYEDDQFYVRVPNGL